MLKAHPEPDACAMDTTAASDAMLAGVENLSRFHREHEKHYAEAPLHDAIALQRASRTLKALAERWTTAEPDPAPSLMPFAAARDLNDERAIETSGVLFLEGDDPPAEIGELRRMLATMAADHAASGAWLAQAMET